MYLKNIINLFTNAKEGSLLYALIEDKPREEVDKLIESDENQDGCFIACFHYKYRDKELFEKLIFKNKTFHRCLELALYDKYLNKEPIILTTLASLDPLYANVECFRGCENEEIVEFAHFYRIAYITKKKENKPHESKLIGEALKYLDRGLLAIKLIKLTNTDISTCIWQMSMVIEAFMKKRVNVDHSIYLLNLAFEHFFEIVEFENENFKVLKKFIRQENATIEIPTKIYNLLPSDSEEKIKLKENIDKAKELDIDNLHIIKN